MSHRNKASFLFLFQNTSGHLSQQDLESQMKELIYMDSDLVVTPIIDNPKVWKDALRDEGWALAFPESCTPGVILSSQIFFALFSWLILCLLLCHSCCVATFLSVLSVTLSFLLHWVVRFFSSSSASAQSSLPPLHLWASRPQTFVSQSLRFSMHTWVNFSKRSNCACVMKADGSEHCSLQLGWMGRAHRDHTLSQVLRTADQMVGRHWELGESCFTGILCTQHDFCCFMSLWMYYCITGEWWVFSLRK